MMSYDCEFVVGRARIIAKRRHGGPVCNDRGRDVRG